MERKMKTRTIRIVVGLCVDLLVFGFIIPWAAIQAGRLFDARFPISPGLSPFLRYVFGGVATALGVVWFCWASFTLIRLGHGYMTELFGMKISPVTEQLVTTGPYSVHRHPVCVAYLFILAGVR